MGSTQCSLKLSYYGITNHPIMGEVEAYSIKGQGGRFAMKTVLHTTEQQFALITEIGKCSNQKMVNFYGLWAGGSSPPRIPAGQSAQIEVLWELLNYDLVGHNAHLKQASKDMQEKIMWEIMDTVLQVSQFLQTFDLYLQLIPSKIEFSAAMQPKIYWADILPNNMHRAYEKFLAQEQFRHTLYAPQQLLQMTRTQRRQLSKQKCVIFTLGMIILEAASQDNVKKCYDYPKKVFSEVKKREMMDIVAKKYSPQFLQVLNSLLQFFPKQRFDYEELQKRLNNHFKRGKSEGISIQIEDSGFQKTEKTAESKKVEKSKV